MVDQRQDNDARLYDVASDQSHPLNVDRAVTIGGASADLVVADLPDRPLFSIDRDEGGEWHLLPMTDSVALSVNQKQVSGPTELPHLSVIQADSRIFVFLEHEDPKVSTAFSANLFLVGKLLEQPDEKDSDVDLTRQTLDLGSTMQISLDTIRSFVQPIVPLALPGAIQLPEGPLSIGRDPENADVCLSDVRVSRIHARVERKGNSATITDLKSANGTFVDGERIRKPTEIRQGSRVQIGPHTLVFRGKALHPITHDNNVQLIARNLVRRVPDRKHRGQTKVILDDISLVIQPKEFVCILGPSGSGKTTLLSALSARIPADEGTVFLNGDNLYAHFEALKQNLAVVPQRDVLHDLLPLNLALWYTARLRLPADMSDADIEARIDETLDTVSLVQRQYTQIRQLSGGQIRRASWANEAICNPSLIFLDEVTSGLDEQTDAEMMRLFRRMADDGKTMVCVTHSLSYVEQNCHIVVILADGGVLAFVGPPADALDYFGIERLGDVYQQMSTRSSEEWKNEFRRSKYYEAYVERRLPASTDGAALGKSQGWQPREFIAAWRQFQLLFRRNLSIQWADKRALAMVFGQSLIIGVLLAWLFGDISQIDAEPDARKLLSLTMEGMQWEDLELFPDEQDKFLNEAGTALTTDRSSKLLFLLCISCIWFGCNNSAKEIVKERAIYGKERDVGLKVLSYYSSKVVLLGVLSVAQTTLLFGIVATFTQLGGDTAVQWLFLALASLVGVAMGLAISALASTEDVAVTIVPMVLIPQIILAGLIAPLLHHTREFSQICIPAYWSFQGLMTTLDDTLQERLRDGGYLNLSTDWSPATVVAILAGYIAVFAITALASLHYRD